MKEGLLAAGGVASALAASVCCIVPLVLVSAGVGGAWLGSLTALAAWQPFFLAAAIASVGAGFWLVYRPAGRACAAEAGAGNSARRFVRRALYVKGALWIGAALVGLSVGVDYGAGLFL